MLVRGCCLSVATAAHPGKEQHVFRDLGAGGTGRCSRNVLKPGMVICVVAHVLRSKDPVHSPVVVLMVETNAVHFMSATINAHSAPVRKEPVVRGVDTVLALRFVRVREVVLTFVARRRRALTRETRWRRRTHNTASVWHSRSRTVLADLILPLRVRDSHVSHVPVHVSSNEPLSKTPLVTSVPRLRLTTGALCWARVSADATTPRVDACAESGARDFRQPKSIKYPRVHQRERSTW